MLSDVTFYDRIITIFQIIKPFFDKKKKKIKKKKKKNKQQQNVYFWGIWTL